MRQPQLPVQQLVILSICRFAEPIVLTSILPYLPEMIEYVGVPKNEVARWVGTTSAVAAGCQALMAVPWGTASDYVGRKPIILLCLTFTMILSIVFGMSQNLTMLLVSRGLLGFLNGNVGIIRTMVAEMVPEKELQPRAFSIMPLVWTIGSIFGPAFGGALAKPAEKNPRLFGNIEFLRKYPFALPNLASACFFIVGITTGFLFMKETLAAKKDQRDYGLVLGQTLTRSCTSRSKRDTLDSKAADEERRALLPGDRGTGNRPTRRPTWGQVFTPQSNLVLLAYTLMAMHSMAFDSLFPVFLHYPDQDFYNNPDVHLPFKFAGGFGVDSETIGLFYTIIGIVGIMVQFLLFPAAAQRYGVLTCLKVSSLIFPIIFFVVPFTVLVPLALRRPTVVLIMLAKLTVTIFGFPSCTILLTNSASSLSVLGTLNGVGTSVSSIGRAAGPALMGMAFSYGVEKGAVPVFWMVESEGFVRDDTDDVDDENEDHNTNDSRGPAINGYGTVDSRKDGRRPDDAAELAAR
ncbi:MFS transporter [Penicillium riverlandense]|uniref:MFS transporter n=1 Tax=Penicillium riverlandense TaxID=1903569 RepID=UPI0025492EF0|nr:MFS transporter [Penicillium riverlandense]KAJ5818452.1 MFS transporter [Penicillium riverlandense]